MFLNIRVYPLVSRTQAVKVLDNALTLYLLVLIPLDISLNSGRENANPTEVHVGLGPMRFEMPSNDSPLLRLQISEFQLISQLGLVGR